MASGYTTYTNSQYFNHIAPQEAPNSTPSYTINIPRPADSMMEGASPMASGSSSFTPEDNYVPPPTIPFNTYSPMQFDQGAINQGQPWFQFGQGAINQGQPDPTFNGFNTQLPLPPVDLPQVPDFSSDFFEKIIGSSIDPLADLNPQLYVGPTRNDYPINHGEWETNFNDAQTSHAQWQLASPNVPLIPEFSNELYGNINGNNVDDLALFGLRPYYEPPRIDPVELNHALGLPISTETIDQSSALEPQTPIDAINHGHSDTTLNSSHTPWPPAANRQASDFSNAELVENANGNNGQTLATLRPQANLDRIIIHLSQITRALELTSDAASPPIPIIDDNGHTRFMVNNGVIRCAASGCKKVFYKFRLDNAIRHWKSHNPDRRYACNYHGVHPPAQGSPRCETLFKHDQDIRKHVQRIHHTPVWNPAFVRALTSEEIANQRRER